MPPHGPRAIAKPKNAKGTLRRLIGYLKPHRARLFTVAVCILLSTLITTTGTYLLRITTRQGNVVSHKVVKQ